MPPFQKTVECENDRAQMSPHIDQLQVSETEELCTKIRDDLLQMVSNNCGLDLHSAKAAAFANVADRLHQKGVSTFGQEMWRFSRALSPNPYFSNGIMYHHLLTSSHAQILDCYDLPNGAYLQFLLDSVKRWGIELSSREAELLGYTAD